jgi:methenyltetrahydrofolate cyclohydrolase
LIPCVTDLVGLSIRDYLRELAVSQGAPGAGSSAAIVGATAAALVEMAGRASREDWDGAGGAIAQAAALRARLEPLVQADADALEEALTRLGGEGGGDALLGEALGRAAQVPFQIAEAAADVAELAAVAAECADGPHRTDAIAAAALAEGAVVAAVHLVELNLRTTRGDERSRRGAELVSAATTARERALEAG